MWELLIIVTILYTIPLAYVIEHVLLGQHITISSTTLSTLVTDSIFSF